MRAEWFIGDRKTGMALECWRGPKIKMQDHSGVLQELLAADGIHAKSKRT
jgi:hypothetical protein